MAELLLTHITWRFCIEQNEWWFWIEDCGSPPCRLAEVVRYTDKMAFRPNDLLSYFWASCLFVKKMYWLVRFVVQAEKGFWGFVGKPGSPVRFADWSAASCGSQSNILFSHTPRPEPLTPLPSHSLEWSHSALSSFLVLRERRWTIKRIICARWKVQTVNILRLNNFLER